MSPLIMEERFLKNIGRTIKTLRKRSRLTQEALGEMADICPKYLGEIERGDTNVSVAVIFKLAEALGASPCDILNTNPCILSEKEFYIKKICTLLKDKDEAAVKNVFQAMQLLLEK